MPVTWNGQTYTSSGNYSYLTTNSNGCDSIANLNLIINSTSSSVTTINVCHTIGMDKLIPAQVIIPI